MESPMIPPPQVDQRFSQSANKVFELEEMREMILHYVIIEKKVLISNVRSCRLVNKNWLKSMSRILLHLQEPLFRFHLQEAKDCRFDEENVVEQLGQTLKSVTKSLWNQQRAPPHVISLNSDFFRMKNHQKVFFDFLLICGAGLLSLELELSEDYHPPLLNKSVLLPKLQSFTVWFYRLNLSNDMGSSLDNAVEFIQSIFAASPALKTFEFKRCVFDKYSPDALRTLRLPASLTSVSLHCALDDSKLRVLLDNPLPNLKTLKFLVNSTPFERGLVTSILEKFRKTLENLHVGWSGAECDIDNKGPTTFQLPLMERLKSLKIETTYLEIEMQEEELPLYQRVPVLNHMTMADQTVAMFQKWTGKCRYPTVTSVAISLVEEDDHLGTMIAWRRRTNVDLIAIQTIKTTFPNIQKLDVSLFRLDKMVIWFIMREMRELRALRICVEDSAHISSSDVWDALLIGSNEEEVAALVESPSLWEDFRLSDNISIRNLAELESLELCAASYVRNVSLISDAAFQFAFFKMPNLSKLVLKGSFFPSKKAECQWSKEGREIES